MINLEKENKPTFSHIVAMSENSVIGIDDRLPWNIDYDLKRFKYLSMGKITLFGRKTFESLPKSLIGRKIVIVSKTRKKVQDIDTFFNIDDAIKNLSKTKDREIIIAGGESIYKQTINYVDKIYLTLVHKKIEGSHKYFNLNFIEKNFNLDYEKYFDEELPYSFMTFSRK